MKVVRMKVALEIEKPTRPAKSAAGLLCVWSGPWWYGVGLQIVECLGWFMIFCC